MSATSDDHLIVKSHRIDVGIVQLEAESYRFVLDGFDRIIRIPRRVFCDFVAGQSSRLGK